MFLCFLCRWVAHAVQVLLHMVQVTVSYMLMLVFMTYNIWLCLSVVLGAGLGYLLFGRLRANISDPNEHCH
jgi:copper transporter 1